MKTPKRKTSCRKCKHYRVTMGGSWCNKTLDLDPRNDGCKNYAPNDEVKTRWKRKNRESQLKRSIARLKRELDEVKQRLYITETCIDVYESSAEGEKYMANK